MKLTPLDIHQKEFHRAIRGYSEEEVDKFLDEVAEDFERLFKENIELKEQFEKVKQDLESYSGMEKTLQNALLTAQKSADDVTIHAKKEAELIVRDAELKAKEIIQEAYDLKSKYESTLGHLKQAEEEFRTKFKSMLESYIRIADSTAVLADIGNNIVGINDKASSELEKVLSEKIVSVPEVGAPLIESAASVGANTPDIPEVSEIAEIPEIPKIGMAKTEEETSHEPEPAMPNNYIGETYVLDNFIQDTYPDLTDPLASNNGNDVTKNPAKDVKDTKDVKDDFFDSKPGPSDFDSLAF